MGLRRRLGAGLLSLVGTALVFALVLSMNGGELRKATQDEAGAVRFSPPPPPVKPPAPPRSRPKAARKAPSNAPPAPVVGASLAGLDLGLESFGPGGAEEASSLLGDLKDVVMSTEAVDSLPEVQSRVQPVYPDRARKKGVSGSVQLSLLVGVDGAVRDAKVLQSSPPEIFDAAALEAVRQWRFSPALYEGRPVPIRVTQTLRFGFEGG